VIYIKQSVDLDRVYCSVLSVVPVCSSKPFRKTRSYSGLLFPIRSCLLPRTSPWYSSVCWKTTVWLWNLIFYWKKPWRMAASIKVLELFWVFLGKWGLLFSGGQASISRTCWKTWAGNKETWKSKSPKDRSASLYKVGCRWNYQGLSDYHFLAYLCSCLILLLVSFCSFVCAAKITEYQILIDELTKYGKHNKLD